MDYRKHYNLLMKKAKKRKTLTGYFETHHIVPRSEGGTNNKDNLVQLTPREHYISHYLLWMEDPQNESRCRSFWFMCQDIKRRCFTVPSRTYEKARIAVSEINKTGKNVQCRECGKYHYRQAHTLTEKMYCSYKCYVLGRTDPSKPGSKYRERTGWSDESRQALSERRSNSKTINNGNSMKYVLEKDLKKYLNKGWELGPLKRERRKWCNDGKQEKLIPYTEPVPLGWEKGRIKGWTEGKKAVSKNGTVKFVSDPKQWVKKGWKLGNEKYYPGYLHQKRNSQQLP